MVRIVFLLNLIPRSRNYVSHIKREFQNPVCSFKNTEAGGKLSKSFSSK